MRHVPTANMAGNPGSRLAAVSDVNAASAEKLAAFFGPRRWTEATLADKIADAVPIATSTAMTLAAPVIAADIIVVVHGQANGSL